MKQLYQLMHDILEKELPVMLVKVVASRGSAPGGQGATMLVDATGRRAGTIGGGVVEHLAEVLAVQLLGEGRSATKEYTLRHGDAGDIGMVCGGDITVYLCYVAPSAQAASFAQHATDAFGRQENTWLLLELQDGISSMALYSKTGGLDALSSNNGGGLLKLASEDRAKLLASLPVQHEFDSVEYYGEPLVRAGRAVIFGGGHVSQALVPVLTSIGFPTVVYDDRPEFANATLFPTADEIIVGDFSDVYSHMSLTPDDWLVIVTRGHAADYDVQRQVLTSPFAYVGVIGSRTKIRAVNARLLAAGIPQAAIDTVHTPIGLAIGAETPAEIAVSIAGEMIQLRAALLKEGK